MEKDSGLTYFEIRLAWASQEPSKEASAGCEKDGRCFCNSGK